MAKGELEIKNDEFAAIIGRLLEEKSGKPQIMDKSPQTIGEDLVGTYALDMLYSGMDVGVELDFSYASLKNIPVAAKSCYERYKKGDHPDFAIESTAKSVAAYFLALAMNEHDLHWEVQQRPILLNPTAAPSEPMWGVFRVLICGKKKVDFLLPVLEGCKVMGNRLLTFYLAPLMQEYKAAVGVNLEKRGLSSIAFEL